MTEPRDGAPEDELEPIDDDLDEDGERIDDADVDAIEGELLDEAEAEAIEADEAEIDDYEAAIREVSGEPEAAAPAAAVAAERRGGAKRRAEGKTPARAPSPSEVAVHVREDVSRVFVIVAVAVFGLILLNGLLLGTGGLLRPLPTPTPTPTPSASASASASPSGSPGASASGSPSASPSAASSASPSAAASPSPS